MKHLLQNGILCLVRGTVDFSPNLLLHSFRGPKRGLPHPPLPDGIACLLASVLDGITQLAQPRGKQVVNPSRLLDIVCKLLLLVVEHATRRIQQMDGLVCRHRGIVNTEKTKHRKHKVWIVFLKLLNTLYLKLLLLVLVLLRRALFRHLLRECDGVYAHARLLLDPHLDVLYLNVVNGEVPQEDAPRRYRDPDIAHGREVLIVESLRVVDGDAGHLDEEPAVLLEGEVARGSLDVALDLENPSHAESHNL
mmetsp:Transcript_21610/g.42012  ORF Transcript_21610/g.42012 Transcript_21610/m.42012 type:complete len:250 (-) Transcript_21610:107-856(-)